MNITARLVITTSIAMFAFAANSLLCRLALSTTKIDAATFTSTRLLSGAITLYVIVWLQTRATRIEGNWQSALALFAYAAGFSFAYINLSAATGALLLFGSVQITMIGFGLAKGERPSIKQLTGILLALAGLLYLLLPGATAPSWSGALLMITAGIAWGMYSLLGRGVQYPTRQTTGNFVRSLPFTLVISLIFINEMKLDLPGVGYAIASGALASGLGYAIWYSAVPQLKATTAATVQLSVPAIAAIGGITLLSEPLNQRIIAASILILGGVALYILNSKRSH